MVDGWSPSHQPEVVIKPVGRFVWSGSGRTATSDGFNLQISSWAGPQESVTK